MPEVHEAHNEAHEAHTEYQRPETQPTMTLWSVATHQGTAMPDTTLCAVHFADESERRSYEAMVAGDDDVSDPLRWVESTDNDEVECQICGDQPLTIIRAADIRVLDVVDQGSGGGGGPYSSELHKVDLAGLVLWHEVWFTDSSSGSDWYSEDRRTQLIQAAPSSDTHAVLLPDGSFADFDEYVNEVLTEAMAKWDAAYANVIEPLVKDLKEQVFPFVKS